MPIVMVSLKQGGSKEELEKAKKTATDQGAKITHESKLVPGFHADFPEDKVNTLQTNDHIEVEADKNVSV